MSQSICNAPAFQQWACARCFVAPDCGHLATQHREIAMIRKLKSGLYRLYSGKQDPKTRKRRNLGTFQTREAAVKHEREVQFFKRR
jgi:hypothetical protein